MSTAPILNISNTGAGGGAAGRVGNAGGSSGESFGDVLNREVNNGSGSDNSGAGAKSVGNSNSGNQSNTSDSSNSKSSSSSTSSASPSNGSTSGTGSSTGTSGKGKSNSSTSDSTNGSDPSVAGSAQLLALVSNVQQATTVVATSQSPSTSPSNAIGTVSSTSGASTAANASAIADATITTTASSDKTVASNADATASTFEAALKDAKHTNNSGQALQTDADDDANAEQSSQTQPQTILQNAAAKATPLVLPVTSSDKSMQASVAQMDEAALKAQQTVQTPQPTAIVATQQLAATTQMQASNASDTLSPQVGSTAWDQALGQKIVWMAGGNQQSASLTLNPPDLGPMQVVLNVNNSHATVTFTSAQPEVRQALEHAMPKLREMLGDAGIQLGQASINSGSPQQQNMASQQGSGNSRSQASDNAIDAIETAASNVARASPISVGLGLVDTFA